MAEFSPSDRRWMRRALSLARRGWGRTAPNPMVGAVLVHDGARVGEGWHAEFGAPHAEVVALSAAGARARGATAYVTLEPCNHTGNTPPCALALIAAGVARVVYAVRDPNPVAAGGADALRRAGIVVDEGLMEAEARELSAAFFSRFSRDRPFVTLKLAVSLDSALTDAACTSGWMTGPKSRREVHRLRANHDAVAVGSGTVIADDPKLTVRGVRSPRVPPRRVVFDRRGRIDAARYVVRTARRWPTIIVTGDPVPPALAALAAKGVELLSARSVAEGLRALLSLGIDSVLCEGGAGLAGSLLAAGAVDRLVIFRAPIVLGAGALGAFGMAPPVTLGEARRWRIVDQRALDADVVTTYAPGD